MTHFIEPNLVKFTSFKDLTNPQSKYLQEFIGNKFRFNDLFKVKKAFVLAEPGYGKTRLFQEIVSNSNIYNCEAVFIDLKSISGNLAGSINTKLKIAKLVSQIKSENELQEIKILKTDQFQLVNSGNCIICLDALDEITLGNSFAEMADKLKILCKEYCNCKIFISCRDHHFKRYESIFSDLNFEYIIINKFSVHQVEDYLKKFGFSTNDTEQLERTLAIRKQDLILQVPRYLNMIGSVAKEKGLDYAKKLNKTELFEQFIYRKLDIEEKRIGAKKKELIKRVLEKLALIMEIYQVNSISKEELITFFDDVHSNLNISFLQQVKLEEFYDKSLLKDNIDTIEFENTEFQEYLAAKELKRMGRADQVIFDLAVDQDIREIIPSWFNTLTFLMDLDIGLLKPLLDFGKKNTSKIQNEQYHRLLTSINTEKLPLDLRKQIFESVFLYYQNILYWIDYHIAENLSYYYDISQSNLLKDSIDARKYKNSVLNIRRSNTAEILDYIIQRKILPNAELDYWKSKLIVFTKESKDTDNSVLQRQSMYALRQFNDISLIERVYPNLNLHDQNVLDSLLIICREINANNAFSINCFVEGTKRESLYARYGLYEIKAKKYIAEFFKYLVEDNTFLNQFYHYESIFKDKEQLLIGNINAVLDDELYGSIMSFLIHVFSDNNFHWALEQSKFVKNICLLMKKYNSEFIFDFISNLDSGFFKNQALLHINFFSSIVEKIQVEKFINELLKVEGGKDTAFSILIEIIRPGRADRDEIYEIGRKYFPDEYKRHEEADKKHQQHGNFEEQRIEKIYNDFLIRLEPQPGKYSSDLFEFFNKNKNDLINKITAEERQRLITLVYSMFKNIEPLEQSLKITSKDGDRKSYHISGSIFVFRECLIIARDLKLDVSKYRQHILNYILFTLDDTLSIIFELIPNPSNEEINELISIYNSKRTDDLYQFHPESFFHFCKQYNIIQSLPVLKGFVENQHLYFYTREIALEIIKDLNPDQDYFCSVFDKYINDQKNEIRLLAINANAYLIELYKNEQAISWRMNAIKENTFPYVEKEGSHTVEPQESELRDKNFAYPLMDLKDIKFKDQFYDLLEFSFQLVSRGKDYWSYTKYIWDIVLRYFSNLKAYRTYDFILELEQFIDKYSAVSGVNWFQEKLIVLKNAYIAYIGKPSDISECIKKYNRIKSYQYLSIATEYDLVQLVRSVIKNDLQQFIESEGFYKEINTLHGKQEDLIQKTLKIKLESCFSRRGLRPSEVLVRREEQLYDDKRPDILISYGFIGPLVLELKRCNNKEVSQASERKKYKKKMIQYVKGNESSHGFLLLLQTEEIYTLEKYLPILKELYRDTPIIEVYGYNCLSDKSSPSPS